MMQDPSSRVTCETAVTTSLVLVMGEVTTKAQIDVEKIVREALDEIGYNRDEYGFDCKSCKVIVAFDKQSTDIAMRVDKSLEAKKITLLQKQMELVTRG